MDWSKSEGFNVLLWKRRPSSPYYFRILSYLLQPPFQREEGRKQVGLMLLAQYCIVCTALTSTQYWTPQLLPFTTALPLGCVWIKHHSGKQLFMMLINVQSCPLKLASNPWGWSLGKVRLCDCFPSFFSLLLGTPTTTWGSHSYSGRASR